MVKLKTKKCFEGHAYCNEAGYCELYDKCRYLEGLASMLEEIVSSIIDKAHPQEDEPKTWNIEQEIRHAKIEIDHIHSQLDKIQTALTSLPRRGKKK